jgi:hypothetical protein
MAGILKEIKKISSLSDLIVEQLFSASHELNTHR